MYLAVVIDLFSRQVVGWAIRDRADTELVVNEGLEYLRNPGRIK